MPTLPTTTPQRTLPIKSFVVYLADGRIFQITADSGEGFFRQQIIKGETKSILTFECFIVNGKLKIIPIFGKGGAMTTEDPEPDEEEEKEDDEE